MNTNKNKLVTILNTSFLHEVQIAQGKLDSEGIQSFIIDEHITSTIGTAFVDGYRLQVNSNNLDQVKTILTSIIK